MRFVAVLAVVLIACSPSSAASRSSTPSPTATVTAPPCARTTNRDASGVVTANGMFGIIGDSFTPSATAMNDALVIVRRGATIADTMSVAFQSISAAPLETTVWYSVGASTRPNPWGDVAFTAGWKPIGRAGSCWRLFVDSSDTGLVLEVGR